jgi:DnaJ like chaperone protein
MSIWSRIRDSLSAIGDSVAGFLKRLTKKTPPEKTIGFTIGMIALGAKMAKADGSVSGAEITAFKQVFHVPEKDLPAVARVFNLAKQDVTGYEFYARQVSRLFNGKSPILEDVLDGLFHIAQSDGGYHDEEIKFLSEVARIFGFSEDEFDAILARHGGPESADPYRVLGVKRGEETAVIRSAYRKLAREHHPDKHIAAGVPEEMVEMATKRLARINAAYDLIMKERAA